jgi:hypothetical protein
VPLAFAAGWPDGAVQEPIGARDRAGCCGRQRRLLALAVPGAGAFLGSGEPKLARARLPVPDRLLAGGRLVDLVEGKGHLDELLRRDGGVGRYLQGS